MEDKTKYKMHHQMIYYPSDENFMKEHPPKNLSKKAVAGIKATKVLIAIDTTTGAQLNEIKVFGREVK